MFIKTYDQLLIVIKQEIIDETDFHNSDYQLLQIG